MPLTQDRNTSMKATDVVVLGLAASTKVFAGSLVMVNAAGYLVPGATATGLTYAGRAEEFADNTSGAAGAAKTPVRRNKAFKWTNDGSIVQANMLKTAYVVDDGTVAATDGGGTRSAAGRIVGIDSDGVWVE
jgi:hypothetical protein